MILFRQTEKEVFFIKTDISKNNLYFKRIINVIKSEIRNGAKPLFVNGRHSDAFVYILEGSCTYLFDDGNEFTVNGGDILYLADKSVYTMKIRTENYAFIFCDFEFHLDAPRKSDVFSPKNSADAENLFFRLWRHYKKTTCTTFSECMSILYKIYGIIHFTADDSYMGSTVKQKIETAKEYIDTNFNNSRLSVSFLADMCGMSEVYLRKLFAALYGVSPSQYIISVRIKKSQEYMKYPFLSLEDCALQSGFSTLQYFSRAFKKTVGIPPSQYRQKNAG